MRSAYVYLKGPKTDALVSFLDSICTKRKDFDATWLVETDNDPVLYIDFYEKKYWDEIEPQDWKELVKKLGAEPELSICVDISGRHPGKDELFSFLELLLTSYEGVVLDDYTEYAWNIKEILDGELIEGHPFFDYIGWYEEDDEAGVFLL
jgi:hypothetical protein